MKYPADFPERARYYQSVIDMDNLSKGENYTRLKDTYIIFLCLKDVFRRGLPLEEVLALKGGL